MPPFRRLLALVAVPSDRRLADRLTASPAPLLATIATLALIASGTTAAGAQGRAASGTPLHVPTSRFEFVVSGDTLPPAQLVAVHNGGTTPLTRVRLTRVAYAGSPRGAAWLVALPRQSAVAANELATVGALCVDAAGLPAGTYHATAAVAAREVPEPVAISITLVVTDAAARPRRAATRCETAVSRKPGD